MSTATLPNFVIIGAAKSGTTALYHYLRQHPDIYMSPQKETNFFAFEGQKVDFRGPGDEGISQSSITDLGSYQEQFSGVLGETAVGEASPWYLYLPGTAENMRRHIPEAKLIAILRNPVDRAFSSYLHLRREGQEQLSFEEGLAAEEKRIAQGWEPLWHYKRAGFYAPQIKQFFELFEREQICFYLYEEFSEDPGAVLRDIYRFLGVDESFSPRTSIKHNVTGVPRNKFLWRLIREENPLERFAGALVPPRYRAGLKRALIQRLLKKPVLLPDTRRELARDYREDVLYLQDLIGLDLAGWIEE